MNNTNQIFENKEFGAIRTMSDEKGEPLFCAKDVCDALGYKRVSDAISGRVEEEDTVKCRTLTNGGAQLILFHQRVRSLPKHLTCERMMSQTRHHKTEPHQFTQHLSQKHRTKSVHRF